MFATVYGLNANEVLNTGFVATLALDPALTPLTPSVCPAHPTVPITCPAAPKPNPDSDFKPIKTIISKMETSDPVTQAVIDNVVGKLPLKKEPLRCDVCNISVSGQSVYDQHILGAKHKRKLAQQQQGGAPEASSTAQGASVPSNAAPGTPAEQASAPSKTIPVFPCKVCGIVVNSAEQLLLHKQGKQHMKKAAQASSNPGGVGPNKNTPNKVGLDSDDPLPDGVEKKVEGTATLYTCTLCNKLSNSLDQLSVHMGSRIHKSRTRGVFGTRSAPYDRKKRHAQATFRAFRPGGTLGADLDRTNNAAQQLMVSYPAYNASVVTGASAYGFSESPRSFKKNTRGNGNSYSQIGFDYNSANNSVGAGNQYNGGYVKSGNPFRNGASSYNAGNTSDLYNNGNTGGFGGNKSGYGNAGNLGKNVNFGKRNSYGNASRPAGSYDNNFGKNSSYGSAGNYANNGGYDSSSNFGGYTNSYDDSTSYGFGSAAGRGGKKLFANKYGGGYNNYEKITPSRAKHYFNAATALNQPLYQTPPVEYMNY